MVLTLVTASLVGGTFAKYTSTAEGTGTVQVAKWAVNMKPGVEKNESGKYEFKLINNNTAIDTDEGIIAPGSEGVIQLSIDGTGSQIGYEYNISVDTTGLGEVPIRFYTDAKYENALEIDETSKVASFSGKVTRDKVDALVNENIHWRWEGPANDTADTELGMKTEGVSGQIEISMTATQLTTESPAS